MQPFFASILAFAPLLSAMTDGLDTDALSRYGLIGAVLLWFMTRVDKRLVGIESGVNGLKRAMMLDVLSRPTTSQRARTVCREELRQTDPELADEAGGE